MKFIEQYFLILTDFVEVFFWEDFCVGGYVGGFFERFRQICPMESSQFLKMLGSTTTLSVFRESKEVP